MLEATTRTVPDPSRRGPLVAGAWLTLGVALALSGVLRHAPQLGFAFVAVSVIGWSLAYAQRGAVRAWADALPVRALVALHIVRLPIGAVFLWEAARGQLPQLFADRAGWGDIAVGAAAIAVTFAAAHRPRVVRLFALVGLADILVALGTGAYLAFGAQDPLFTGAIARLPYPLLPFVIVPAVIITHLLMLARGASRFRGGSLSASGRDAR
jgi:hypothetical protein